MNRSFFLLIAISFSLGACKKNAPPIVPANPALSVPPRALTVRTILTHRRDTTMTAPDTTTDFDMRDTIHGIIETQNALDGTILDGKWYFAKTSLMIAQNSATLSVGTNLSHFDLINAHPWPLGNYKLYVFADSVLEDSAQFTVENKR